MRFLEAQHESLHGFVVPVSVAVLVGLIRAEPAFDLLQPGPSAAQADVHQEGQLDLAVERDLDRRPGIDLAAGVAVSAAAASR